MSGQSYSLSYNVDVKANAGSVKKLMSDLQNVLNGLTLPKGLADQFAQEFNKFGKEMAKYDASLLKGMPTDKKTMNQSNSSWSNIEASVLRVQQLMNTLGNMPGLQLMSKDAQAQIDGVNRALEEYQQKIQAIRDSKGYKELVEGKKDTSGKKTSGIADYEEEIRNIERRIRQQRSALSDATSEKMRLEPNIAKFMGGDPEKILSQYEDISARLARIKGEIRSGKDVSGENDLLKTLGINPENTDQAISRIEQLQRYVKTLNDVSGSEARIAQDEGLLQQQVQRLEALKLKIQDFEQGSSKVPLENLKSSLSELTGIPIEKFGTSLEQVKQTLESFTTSKITEGANSFKNAEANVNELRAATEKAADGQKKLNQAFDGFMSKEQDMANFKHRFSYFFSLTGITQTVRRVFRDVTNTIKELDSVMTETAVVTDFTVSDMWDKLPEYTKKASQLGTSIASLYEATTLYYQQGLGDQAAMDLGVETMKMARIANMDAADATEAMTAALRGFNMEINETSATRINDVYSELAAITAADTNQIATAMKKTASIASSANMEFETTAAFLAQIIETTQEAPETAGTAMKTIIARFTEVKELFTKGMITGEDEEGEAIEINKIDKALQSVGISLKDFLLGKKGIDDIFLELASKWDTLDLATQRYIATTAAGSRQQSRFIAMMSDYGRTMELVDAAQNSSGASQEQFDKTLDSLSSKMERLKNAWHEFTMGIIDSDLVKIGVDMLTKLLETVNKITNAFGKVGGPLAKIGIIMGGFKLGRSLFMKSATGQAMTTMARNMGLAMPYMGGFMGQYRNAKLEYIQKGYDIGKDPQSKSYVPMQPMRPGGLFGRLFGPSMKEVGNYYDQGIARLTADQSRIESELSELNRVPELKAAAQAAEPGRQAALMAAQDYEKELQAKYNLPSGAERVEKMTDEEAAKEIGIQNRLKETSKANVEYQKQLKKTGYSTEKVTKKEEELKEKREEVAKAQEDKLKAQQDLNLKRQYGIGQATGTTLMLAGMGFGVVGSIARNNGKEELAEGLETASMVATTGGMALQSITSIASTLGASLGTVAAVVAAIVVAAAALFAVYQGYTDAQNSKKLERIQEETSQNEKNIEESKKEIKSLEEAKVSLGNLSQELKELTHGTTEWKETLLKLNNEIFDLLDRYPSLVAEGYVTKDASGAYSIKEEGWDSLIQAEERAILNYTNRNMGLSILEQSIGAEMSFEEAFSANSDWSKFLFGAGDFLDSDVQTWARILFDVTSLTSTMGIMPLGILQGGAKTITEGFSLSNFIPDSAEDLWNLANGESITWGNMLFGVGQDRLGAFLPQLEFIPGFHKLVDSYEENIDTKITGYSQEEMLALAEAFAKEGLSFSALEGMTKEDRRATRDKMKDIISDILGISDKEEITNVYDMLRDNLGIEFDKLGNQALIHSEAIKQYTGRFVDNAVGDTQLGIDDTYQDGISNLLALTTYSDLEKVLEEQKNQLEGMSEQNILREYAKEFGKYYAGGKVYTDSTMTQVMDINKEAAIEALATTRATSLVQEDAQNLANLVGTGNTDLFNDIFVTEGQGLNTEIISKYKKDGIINFDALSQDLGTDLLEIASITGKSLEELQGIISNNFEMAENRINNQRKDLTHKMAKYSSGEGAGEEGRYDDSAILLRALEEKYGEEGREMLEGVISSLEMSGDESVAASWSKFYNQIVQDGVTLAEAQKLADTITDINWANPIEAADQLQEEIKHGSSASKEFATHMQETGKSFFGVGSQIRYLIESSEEFESMSEELDEIIEQHGEISAADIYDLADQYKSLGKIMDNTGASAGALAAVLESVRIGDLGVHQLTDAVLAAIGQIDGLASMIAGLEKDFSNFDPGIDENFASSFIAQASEVFKTNLDKGAVGNSQLDAYMDYLIGEDWDTGLDKNQRTKALKSAGKFFETNSENMVSAWTDMVNLQKGNSVEGLLGERYRGGDLGFNISQNAATGEIELSGYEHLSWGEMAKNMSEVFGITEQMAKALLTDFANYSGDLALLEKQRESDAGEMAKKALGAGTTIGDKKTIDQSEIDAIKQTTGIDITDQIQKEGGVITNFYDEYGILKTGTKAFEEYNKYAGNQKEDFVKSETTNITQEEWLDQNGLTKEQLEWYNKNKSRDSGEDFWGKDNRFSMEASALGLSSKDLEALRGLEDLGGGYGEKTTDFFDMAALEDQLAKSGLSEAVQEQVKLGALQGMLGDDTINEMGRAEKPYEVKARMSDGSEKAIQVAAGQTFEEAYNQAEQAAQNEALAQAIADAFSTEQEVTVTLANDVGAAVKASLSNYTYTITVDGVIGDISGGDADSGGGATGGSPSVGQKPHIGPSYASGLSSAKRPHAALTGELGPELIWRRSQNQFYLAGMNGPEMTTVNPADTVFTAEETKQILNQPDGPKMPGFVKGLSGPSYASAYKDVTSGGKDTSNKDSKAWENPFDKLYNLLRKIDEELRERERIERRYEKLLEDLGVSANKIIDISREELLQLEKERKLQEKLVEGRREQIKLYQEEKAELTKYANVTQNERGEDVLRIDWDLIDSVEVTEEGKSIEEYVKQLEEWFDSLTEAEDALWEIEDTIEEIKERGEDEYFDLEEAIKDALEQSYQDQIDKLEDINDAINDTNAELLEGIQKSIEKTRQDRENEKVEEELSDKQRRLSYLQMDTSGSNATEILKLQKELEEGQENYTDTLIDQKISELQEQNDEAAKQREKQIDLLQAQLDHYLETGRIWDEVYQLMDDGLDKNNGLVRGSRLEEILKNEENFAGLSAIGKQEWWVDMDKKVASALAYLEVGRQIENLGVKNKEIEFYTEDGKKLKGKVDDKGNVTTADGTMYNNVYQGANGLYYAGKNYEIPKDPEVEGIGKGTSGSGNGSGNGFGGKSTQISGTPISSDTPGGRTKYTSSGSYKRYYHENGQVKYELATITAESFISEQDAAMKRGELAGTLESQSLATANAAKARWEEQTVLKAKSNKDFSQLAFEALGNNLFASNNRFATGGLADFTGPAWLDGTKSRPELVLNQRDTQNFIQLKDILSSLFSHNLGNSTSTENNGDITYDIDINVESIGSDYDVDKVASRVKTLITEDARYRNNNVIGLKR